MSKPLRALNFLIPLSPIAWKRPGVHGKTFYNQQTHERLATGLYLRQGLGNEPMFTKPIEIDAIFYFKRPQAPKHRKSVYVITTPDTDNLLKHLLDSALDVLYKDDKLVASILARKLYTDNEPCTKFVITELE